MNKKINSILGILILLLEIFSIEFHIVFVEQSYLTQPFFCYWQLYRGLILHVAIEEGLNYRRQGKGRPVCLGDRIPAALAVLPRKRLNSAGLSDVHICVNYAQ